MRELPEQWSVSYTVPGDDTPRHEQLITVLFLIGTLGVAIPVMLFLGVEPLTTQELIDAALIFVVYLSVASAGVVLNLRVRSLSLSLTDIPLVLCVLLLQPIMALTVVVCYLTVLWVFGRRVLVRAIFNLGNSAVELTIMYVLLRFLPVGELSNPWTWISVLIAVSVTGTSISVMVLGYLDFINGTKVSPFTRDIQIPQLLAGAFGTVVGCATVFLLEKSIWAAGPCVALICLAALFHQFVWGYSSRVKALNNFRDRADNVGEDERSVLQVLAEQASHLLSGCYAEVHVGTFGLPTDTQVLHAFKDYPDHPAFRRQREDKSVVVAVFDRDQGCQGIIRVAHRDHALGSFQPGQTRILRLLVGLASSRWRSAALFQRSQREGARDQLTGIGNRIFLLDFLADRKDAGRLVKMRIDMMARITTAFGIDVASGVIQQVVVLLEEFKATQEDVQIARVGDETFAVWLPGSCDTTVEQLHDIMGQEIVVGPLRITLDFAIGYTDVAPGTAAQSMLHQAHSAVTSAVLTRSAKPVRFDADDVALTRDRVALSEDLRHAIIECDIDLAFQPKIDPATGIVVGGEALARWYHHSRGFIPPDEFIELAENSNQMQAMTNLVLHRALTLCGFWQTEHPGVGVSINVSPKNLIDPLFADEVAEALEDHNVPASMLTIEVTETAMMTDPEAVVQGLQKLRQAGVAVSVDDFGTGYSSLSYLRDLPITEAKIDKSFVMSLSSDAKARNMIQHMVPLLHSVGVTVVAEGVEDQETREFLASVKCDFAQGYAIARPMAVEAFTEWLVTHELNPIGHK